MPHYKQMGKIPAKRHTVFRNPQTNALYAEELFGTQGFSGVSSLVYHIHPPTMVKEVGKPYSVAPEIAIEDNMQALSLRGFDIQPEADYLQSRKTLFVNNDMSIGLAAPSQNMEEYFFKNADADEMLFIHKGSGTLHSMYGQVPFKYGDYLIIPRGNWRLMVMTIAFYLLSLARPSKLLNDIAIGLGNI